MFAKQFISTCICICVLAFYTGCASNKTKANDLMQNDTPNSTQQREASDEDLYAIINSVALGMLNVATNTEYRAAITSLAQEQFDGDDNVLLKTIKSDAVASLPTLLLQGIDTYQPLITNNEAVPYPILDDAESIALGIDGYSYTNPERTLYLQVYIPFIDEVDLTSMPVIALLTEDDENLKGYELDAEGHVNVIDLTEEIAKNRLVWVVSINEVVNDEGEVMNLVVNTELPNSNRTTAVKKSIWLHEINISNKKEGWGAGRADISWVARKLLECGTSAGNVTAQIPMAKISNSQLNTWVSQIGFWGSNDLTQNNGGGNLDEEEFLCLLAFEKDASTNANQRTTQFSNLYTTVPAPGQYGPLCNNPTNHNVFFFSKESAYGVTGNFPIPYHEINVTSTRSVFTTLNWAGGSFRLSGRTI